MGEGRGVSNTVLVAVWSFFYYQTALCVAFYSAAFVASAPGTDLIWRVTYWLVIFVAINIHVMIVPQ